MESKVDFSSGVKYDIGKIRYDLVPPEIEEALAKVFTIGAIKYKPRNCETGFEYGRLLAAARRHIAEWAQGRDYDFGDTNLHHLTQAAWNLLMIYLCQVRGIGTDDRSPYLLEKAKESTKHNTEYKATTVLYEYNGKNIIDSTEVKSFSWPITPCDTTEFKLAEHGNLTDMLISMGCPVLPKETTSEEDTPNIPEIKSIDITCANFNEEDDNCIACNEYGDENCYTKKVLDNNGDIIKEEPKTNDELMKEIESLLDKQKVNNTIYIEY